MSKTKIRYKSSYDKSEPRVIFDTQDGDEKLKIYIKSKLKVYSVVAMGEARIEREEFCASKFMFRVVKDDIVSFNQGDAVSVKYDGKVIFYGYIFSKKRDKDNLIEVVAYDSMRYLKNRRSYTRGKMTLEEIVRKIVKDNALAEGTMEHSSCLLPAMAVDNLSLLDVLLKACKDERSLSGKRFIVYDDGGFITMKNEDNMHMDVLIDSSQGENYSYSDTIDSDVYNMVLLYNDTKKINLREITVASDKEAMEKWGTLILSKKATDVNNADKEAENLLREYNRINREIVIKGVCGNVDFMPGCRIWVRMVMGDLNLDGFVRCKKAVHIFTKNLYTTDLYIDGSEIE